VSSRDFVSIAAGVLTGFALLLLAGHGPWTGSVLLSIGSTGHGIHTGDLPVLGLWAGAMICCWRIWRG
jgi:hypothetical protein